MRPVFSQDAGGVVGKIAAQDHPDDQFVELSMDIYW